MVKTISAAELHAHDMATDPAYRAEYERLGPIFDLINAFIEARTRSGLTREQVAERMGISVRVLGRMESGGMRPSLRTLERYAAATCHRLSIKFEPIAS